MTTSLPTGPEGLTAEWLTDALRAARGLTTEAVQQVEVAPFADGVGVMGRLFRLHLGLSCGAADDVPRTLVAKLPTTAAANLGLAHGMRFYERELTFYEHAAERSPLRTPEVYFRAMDEKRNFVLLMEDVGPLSVCDQVEGASEELLRKIPLPLARHHAAFWGRTQSLSWAARFDDPELAQVVERLYQMALEPALANFADCFSPRMRKVARTLDGNVGALWTTLAKSGGTLAHGDLRLDNLAIDGGGEVVCFDWQISGIQVGTYDLAFLMSQSVGPELRARIEDELLREYYEGLRSGGVEDYSFECCERDYRRTALVCLIYPVIVCGMLDVGNERGAAFARVSLERSLASIDALDADAMFV